MCLFAVPSLTLSQASPLSLSVNVRVQRYFGVTHIGLPASISQTELMMCLQHIRLNLFVAMHTIDSRISLSGEAT